MFAGMQVGHFGDAARGAAVMADLLDDVLVAPPTTHMMMTLEGYRSTIAHVDIRFGRWQAVLDRAFDGDPACLPVSRAMHHYARAVAGAALGHAEAAQEAAEAFWQARAAVPAEYAFFNNPADAILEIADLMMRGEMAYHAGEVEMGFELLRRAAAAEDRLGYNEPRAWMHPPRHALGALLLEQGRMAEAAHVYEIDLGYDDSRSAVRIVAIYGHFTGFMNAGSVLAMTGPAGSPTGLARCAPLPTGTSPHPAFAAGAPVCRGHEPSIP
jgi:hypothetical protein